MDMNVIFNNIYFVPVIWKTGWLFLLLWSSSVLSSLISCIIVPDDIAILVQTECVPSPCVVLCFKCALFTFYEAFSIVFSHKYMVHKLLVFIFHNLYIYWFLLLYQQVIYLHFSSVHGISLFAYCHFCSTSQMLILTSMSGSQN